MILCGDVWLLLGGVKGLICDSLAGPLSMVDSGGSVAITSTPRGKAIRSSRQLKRSKFSDLKQRFTIDVLIRQTANITVRGVADIAIAQGARQQRPQRRWDRDS